MFYVMLGVIVALLLMFLVLRPKGTQSGGSDQKKSSLDVGRSPFTLNASKQTFSDVLGAAALRASVAD